MDRWRLTTLGRYALARGETIVAAPATLKARALLVFLALHRNADVSRERLLELLWPLADPERARANLKTATWSLRRVLREAGFDPDEALCVARATLRWSAPIDIDVEVLYGGAAPAALTEAARAGVAVYGGDFLEGDYDEWAVAERERAAGAFESILHRLATGGDEGAALTLLARDPYDEAAYSVAIAAADRRGDRTAARRLRERLATSRQELGIEPSASAPPAPVDASSARGDETRGDDSLVAPPLRFAGREAELARVRSAIEAALRGEAAGLAFVGDAGIGKSALLERARELASERGFRVVSAAAHDLDTRTYGLWESLFEAVLDLPFARFASSSGADAAARLARELRDAMRSPCAIFLDDVHLLGGEASVVFRAFVALARAGQVLVVAARPQGEAIARMAASHGADLAILEPLDERAAIAAMGPYRGLSDDVAQTLHARSGGHPLFLAGLIELLTRNGGLQRVEGKWQARSIATLALDLPPSLRATFEAQLRSRGSLAANVACALALEPDADASMLAAALQRDDAAIADALDDLIALRAVVQPETGPPFAFAHDAIAEVAATLLNRARRTRLHDSFASALARRGERGIAPRLARHCEAASRYEDAAHAYAVAAREALEWFAPQRAAEHALAGLRALRSLANGDGIDERQRRRDALAYELEASLARARVLSGDDTNASGPVAHAVHAARASGDRAALGDALALEAAVALNCHRIEEAIASASEAVAVARASGDFALAARAGISLAHSYAHAATAGASIAAAQSAVEFGIASGDARALAASLDALLRAQIIWWRFDDARQTAQRQREAARRAGWLPEAAALGTSAILAYYCGDLHRASEELAHALAIANDESGERRWTVAAAGLDRLKVGFFARYLEGVVALAAGDAARAFAIASALDAEPLARTSYMICNNLLHLQIDALLETPNVASVNAARERLTMLRADPYEQGSVLDLSGSYVAACARVAAFSRDAAARAMLGDALRDVERHASATPLECDRAFERLARAAEVAGAADIAATASARAEALRGERRRAAGLTLR